jgi:RNA polymerase-binding transcription factor DksA
MAKKVAKKKTAKKAAKKTPAKNAAGKGAKNMVKKAAKKAAKKISEKKAAKKTRKRAKTAIAEENLPPVVIKKAYVRPEKLAKLNGFEKKQQRRLLELRDQITDVMYGIQNETIRQGAEGADASGAGMHQGDAGSDAYDRDFALNMLSQEANALGEIEAALQRLETGVYGLCEESGAKIPRPRLEAIPFARLTVERQAAREQEGSKRNQSGPGYGFH